MNSNNNKRYVTDGRHVCVLSDDYRLSYLDGTGFGQRFDTTWKRIEVEDSNVDDLTLEPRHRFGDVYLLHSADGTIITEVMCAFPGSASAWVAAVQTGSKQWSEIVEATQTKRVTRSHSALSTLDEGLTRPERFAQAAKIGEDIVLCLGSLGRRRWAMPGAERRMSWDGVEATVNRDDVEVVTPSGVLDPVTLGASAQTVTLFLRSALGVRDLSVFDVAVALEDTDPYGSRELVEELIHASALPASARDTLEAFAASSPLNKALVR